MYSEDDFIPLSALQHWAFCPRQCALIHLECEWEENRFTVEGSILHKKAHTSDTENRPGCKIARGLRIHSFILGLVGQADVVEFHKSDQGIILQGHKGHWTPFPVEYKRGRPKTNSCDEVQLCAQAVCLEEMLKTAISKGALYYGMPRRRKEVLFTDGLRNETKVVAQNLHEMMKNKITPKALYSKKCDSCSLCNNCLTKAIVNKKKVQSYLDDAFDSP